MLLPFQGADQCWRFTWGSGYAATPGFNVRRRWRQESVGQRPWIKRKWPRTPQNISWFEGKVSESFKVPLTLKGKVPLSLKTAPTLKGKVSLSLKTALTLREKLSLSLKTALTLREKVPVPFKTSPVLI
jgi:hypothetical protein